MQIVLVIWSTGKKQALKVFSSNLLFISYCWNFIFISSCYMARQEDGRNEKLALFQHYPAKPHMEEFSAAFVSLTCDVLGFHSIRIRN